jgi:cyclic pyranopterin phosphate synthase
MTIIELGVPSVQLPVRGMPTDGPMVDTFGRVATDLRVSLTDRCNLRCTYCMPAEGLDWLPGEQLLRTDELTRLLRIAVTRLGITSVRFTGGEPLVAKHLEDVVAVTASLTPRPEITLTTNGIGLDKRAAKLKQAGLDRINVSLDTVDAAHFARITRRDRLHDVLNGLEAAKAAGLRPVKVNAVLDPVTGLDDAVALLRFCLDHGYQLRIINRCPGRRPRVEARPGHRRRRRAGPSGAAISIYDWTGRAVRRLRAVGRRRRSRQGGHHRLGLARSARRVTARGSLPTARSATACSPHGPTYGASCVGADDALAAAWRAPVGQGGRPRHQRPDFVQPDRPMSAIGG